MNGEELFDSYVYRATNYEPTQVKVSNPKDNVKEANDVEKRNASRFHRYYTGATL